MNRSPALGACAHLTSWWSGRPGEPDPPLGVAPPGSQGHTGQTWACNGFDRAQEGKGAGREGSRSPELSWQKSSANDNIEGEKMAQAA